MDLQGIMLSENKPISEGHRLCDYNYITILKRQNYRAGGQKSDCWG